jgi:hypothetical protein
MVFLRRSIKRIGRDMPLLQQLSDNWSHIQGWLFPRLREHVGPLGEDHKRVIVVLELARIEAFVQMHDGLPGRPLEDRFALARAFAAKPVLKLATTRMLIDRLRVDAALRRLCGWEHACEVPSEATFSRAFAAFAAGELPARVHAALIERMLGDHLVEQVTRDATAIEARETPVKIEPPKRCRKKVAPKRGEPGWENLPRLLRQQDMTLAEMIADLPTHCAVGRKPNSKGQNNMWIGYKLHLDIADGGIPVTALLTSASLNDSQAAIPLATMTAARITHLYELMDSAYDAPPIRRASRALGRVPIIAEQARSDQAKKAAMQAERQARKHLNFEPAEARRLRQRSGDERVNARLKDEFGGRHVRVRGHAKVSCHLMFGIVALAVDQLMRYVT